MADRDRELRAFHRMAGSQAHIAELADCERALGRPERAVDMYRAADKEQLVPTEAVELLIVAGRRAGRSRPEGRGRGHAAGARARLGGAVGGRLRYAYADALLAVGRREEARSGSPVRPRSTRTPSPTRRSGCSTSTAW
jgi:hypothetical protein